MNSSLQPLMDALRQARELLREHGDRMKSTRLHDLEARLSAGDRNAIEGALSEATGGAGSLRDTWLSVAGEDADAENAVNAELDALIAEVERSARAAAAELGVKLIR